MSKLFETTKINGMTLQNRFVRSATWEGMADEDGSCNAKMIELMQNLAKGGVGLIITGHAHVLSEGQASPFQTGMYKDDHIPGLRQVIDAVHDEGGKIVLQIAHAGCQALQRFTKTEPVGPSVFENRGKAMCREITKDKINNTIQAFVMAAVRARKAGFDGIQIHGAHGYLISQFLSPFYNKRTDEYGGSLENRARLLLEVYREIRNSVGNDYPVLLKVNSQDYIENGLNINEMVAVSDMLQNEGIDAVEVSGGTIHADRAHVPVRPGKLDSEDKEVFYREAAITYKEKIKVPLMLVGGIRSFNVADKLVNDGLTDYVSLSRPLIREPDLINRWESGDLRKATCISCNACFKPGVKGNGIYCVALEKEQAT
jgi:2,4-dienoyl-CoA reductase-like NADH-dependent reductase (Old Yellow Enzyme family)